MLETVIWRDYPAQFEMQPEDPRACENLVSASAALLAAVSAAVVTAVAAAGAIATARSSSGGWRLQGGWHRCCTQRPKEYQAIEITVC